MKFVVNLINVYVSASLVSILREVSYKGGTYTYQWVLKDYMCYDILFPQYPLMTYYRLWISLDAKTSAVETASLSSLRINRIVLPVFFIACQTANFFFFLVPEVEATVVVCLYVSTFIMYGPCKANNVTKAGVVSELLLIPIGWIRRAMFFAIRVLNYFTFIENELLFALPLMILVFFFLIVPLQQRTVCSAQ